MGTKFAVRMISKIMTYLANKEGCRFFDERPCGDGGKFIAPDALGFRYEVTIKLVGRTNLWNVNEEPKLNAEQLKQISEML